MGVSASSPKSCLPPVVSPEVRLLICGSLPGEASLRAERYYAHPQNQFWRLLGEVLREPLTELAYDERLELLLGRGGAMRDIAANPLAELAATLPRLQAVGFNGATAARLGRRALAETGLELVDLPSSSPAYTLPFAAKAERWAVLRQWVD
jgi:G:T/U-mismatch repair DNA glycosylase